MLITSLFEMQQAQRVAAKQAAMAKRVGGLFTPDNGLSSPRVQALADACEVAVIRVSLPYGSRPETLTT